MTIWRKHRLELQRVFLIFVLRIYQLTLQPPNYSIGIFTHMKLCLADKIHNFKWVKIIQIWHNGGQQISNPAD